MTEKRNKHWRTGQRNKIYIAKMKLHASYGGVFFLEGKLVHNPRWIDLYKSGWSPVYKSTRTPCSCQLCKGERYSRKSKHKKNFD